MNANMRAARRKALSQGLSNPARLSLPSDRRVAPALILPLLLLAGCVARADADGLDAQAVEPTLVSLELVAEIGCTDCDGDTAITPTAITLFEGGRIAVLDRYEPFVRIFDAAGGLDLSFGTKGQGPGELGTDTGGGMYFSGVYLLPWPDGSLSVIELIPAVFETFEPDGSFRDQHRPDLPLATPSAQAFSPATGSYFRFATLPAVVGDRADMIERCVIEPGVGSECGNFADPAGFLDTDEERAGGSVAMATTPHGDLVVADAGTYRMWVLGNGGAVVSAFARDVPMPQKSDEELEAERAANEARRARGRRTRDISTDRGHMVRAGVQVDGSGRIWVLTMRYTSGTSVFDVFDAGGNFLREIAIEAPIRHDPNQITPFVASGSHLAAIVQLPDGSARVNVYQILESENP